MYDLPVYKVLHKPHSLHLFRWYRQTAHLSLTADTLWWQPSLHIQQSTGIVAVEECKHIGRPTQSFRRVRESACYSSQGLLLLASVYVCVGMCMCVSGLLCSTAGIHTGRLDFTRALMGKWTTKVLASEYQQLGLVVRCFFCHATRLLSSQTIVSHLCGVAYRNLSPAFRNIHSASSAMVIHKHFLRPQLESGKWREDCLSWCIYISGPPLVFQLWG